MEVEREDEIETDGLGGISAGPSVAANELARALISVGIVMPIRLVRKLVKGESNVKLTCTTMGSLARFSSVGISTLISPAVTSLKFAGTAARVASLPTAALSASIVMAATRAPCRAAWYIICHSNKARANSIVPKTSSRKSGKRSANSTRDCPR